MGMGGLPSWLGRRGTGGECCASLRLSFTILLRRSDGRTASPERKPWATAWAAADREDAGLRDRLFLFWLPHWQPQQETGPTVVVTTANSPELRHVRALLTLRAVIELLDNDNASSRLVPSRTTRSTSKKRALTMSPIKVVDYHLPSKTLLASERVTLAEIAFAAFVARGRELVFGKALRAAFHNVFRHYAIVAALLAQGRRRCPDLPQRGHCLHTLGQDGQDEGGQAQGRAKEGRAPRQNRPRTMGRRTTPLASRSLSTRSRLSASP
jgi:glutathione S-transferase